MRIGGVTSKRKIEKWNEEEGIVKTKIWNLSSNLQTIFNAKVGPDCMVIAGSGSYMFDIIAKSMMPYEVNLIAPADWNTFAGIITTKTKIYTGWVDQHPLMTWSDRGIITANDYIMLMGKDKDFNKLKKKHHMIDVWMNAEGYLGLQFEGCNKFHSITKMLMGVEDDEIEFTYSHNDCRCGFGGELFTWKEKDIGNVRSTS
jgi:hypothetical protein